MNSLKSKAAILWGIGVVTVFLYFVSIGVAGVQATTISDDQFEFRSLDTNQQKTQVPGDHDDVTGVKYPNIKRTSQEGARSGAIIPGRDVDYGIFPQIKLTIGSFMNALMQYVSK